MVERASVTCVTALGALSLARAQSASCPHNPVHTGCPPIFSLESCRQHPAAPWRHIESTLNPGL
jgi:hypothetical protein